MLRSFFADDKDWPMWLLSYETLSPDSCIWVLGDDYFEPQQHYALYVEDYVPSLQHVKDEIAKCTGGKNVDFLPVLAAKDFERATPVVAATTYEPPVDEDFMRYAAETGIYFAFLATYEGA